jgi:hypothetical protein
MAQLERREQDAIQVRVAHAELVHVGQRIAQVIDVAAALADTLCDEHGGAVHIEIPGELSVPGVSDEGEGADLAAAADAHAHEARPVDAVAHLAAP